MMSALLSCTPLVTFLKFHNCIFGASRDASFSLELSQAEGGKHGVGDYKCVPADTGV